VADALRTVASAPLPVILPGLLALVEVVVACGGGDPDPEAYVGPPGCQAQSEVCR